MSWQLPAIPKANGYIHLKSKWQMAWQSHTRKAQLFAISWQKSSFVVPLLASMQATVSSL
jgi:hypothetical protein